MNATRDFAALLGRILLAATFVVAGYGKLMGFAGTAAAMAKKGLPMPEVLLVLTIIIELGGGLALVAGWKTRCVAVVMLVFTAIVTVVYHNYWAMPVDQMAMQKIMFMKNLSIIGGLLLLVAFGPGRLALDRRSN